MTAPGHCLQGGAEGEGGVSLSSLCPERLTMAVLLSDSEQERRCRLCRKAKLSFEFAACEDPVGYLRGNNQGHLDKRN